MSSWSPTLPEGGYPSTVQDFVTARRAFYPPVWTTATRPTALEKVLFGFNTDSQSFEYWSGTAWIPVLSSGAPYLPLAGGTMTGTLIGYNAEFNGPMTHPVYPVANAQQGNPALVQFAVQGETIAGSSVGELNVVFGNYINTGAPNGQKVSTYIGVVQGPNGGSSWTLNTDIVRNGVPGSGSNVPGVPGIGSATPGTPGACPVGAATIGYELDYTNWDQDSSPGSGPFTVGMFIVNNSTYRSLSAIYLSGQPENSTTYLWENGIMFADTTSHSGKLIHGNSIFDSSQGSFSYQDVGVHSVASHYLNDTSPVAVAIGGNHANYDLNITDNASTVIRVAGSHTSVVDVTAATISGYGWNGPLSTSGNVKLANGTLNTPELMFVTTGAGTDANIWDLYATTTNLQFRCINDADSAANNFLTVTRSGYVPTSITLDATAISLNGEVGFNGTAPISKPTVTGSKGGNAALASLITALASYGLITDSTT